MIPDVSVSVVTYDNEHCVAPLLEQLSHETEVSWEALVFDNASSDGTRELLTQSNSLQVFLSDENLGYSRAHNRNIGNSRGRYVLLLNPDVRFSDGTLRSLVSWLDANPDKAMVGPLVLEGKSRRPFPPRHFYPGEGMVALEPRLKRDKIAWLNGCCILARRDVLTEIGGFDEDFFLYQAETDLCFRARSRGHSLGFVKDVVVHHLHRQSQREISEYEYSRRLFDGSAVFWRKHYSPRDVLGMAMFQAKATQALLIVGKPLAMAGVLPPQLHRARLEARRDVCRNLAASLKREGVQPSSVFRIAARQSRLAGEWLSQGQFPLDDY